MKKVLTKIAIHTLLFALPLIVLANPTTNAQPVKIEITNPLKATSVSQVMTAFFDILVQLGAVAVVLAIIYAGFLFVAAKGNPEELNKAKKTFYWTIIGSLVLLGAQIIASVIEKTLKEI